MIAQPLAPNALSARLNAERMAVQSLVDLLAREQDALLQGNIDQVGANAELKSRLLVQIAHLAEQRGHALAAASLTPDRRGMAAWLAAHPGHRELVTEWEELLRVMRVARDLNQTNGILIEAGMRANQQALAAIHAAANVSCVYGPDGLSRSSLGKRRLEAA